MKNYFLNKKNKIALISILVYILLMNLFPEILGLIIKAIFSKEYIKENIYNINTFIEFVIYVPLFLIIVYLNRIEFKTDIDNYSKNSSIYSKSQIKSIGLMYAVSFLASILTGLLNAKTSTNQNSIIELLSSNILNKIIITIITCLIAPVVEELIYRKSIFQVLKNKYLAIICSSLVFGFIHVLSTKASFYDKLIIAIPYISSGFVFSYIYEKNDRNIIVPIVCHMLNNTLAILLSQFF